MIRTHFSGDDDALNRVAAECVSGFDENGRVIYTGRNTIKVFDTPYGRLNVKAYRVPSLLNRIVYSFLRKPKGRRAFDYPRLMEAAGVSTPRVIAYMEERRTGLIARSWLVTEQSRLEHTMYEFGDRDLSAAADRDAIAAFARFAARMHEAGVLHRDFSPGNILFDRIDGQWRFSLVDINRMSFGAVSVRKGCRNMARLWGQPAMFRLLAAEYAVVRGGDAEECLKWIDEARTRFWRRFSRRHPVKYTYRPL